MIPAGGFLVTSPAERAWSSEIFRGLQPDEVRGVAAFAHPVEIAAGERIFAEDDPPNGMYVIGEGSVRIVKGGEPFGRDLAVLGEGEVFGEMALLIDGPRMASAIAATPCALQRIDRDAFFLLLAGQDRVA